MSKYVAIIAEARTAVESMPEDNLKPTAFGVILSHLLGGLQPVSSEVATPKIASAPSKLLHKKSTKGGPKAWVKELADEGFFGIPKSSAEIRKELATRSHILKPTDITKPLETLCHDKVLRRSERSDGGKKVICWHNW